MFGNTELWNSVDDQREPMENDPKGEKEPLIWHLKKSLWTVADDILTGLKLPHNRDEAFKQITTVPKKTN